MLDRFRHPKLDAPSGDRETAPPLDVERVLVLEGVAGFRVEVQGTWRLAPLRDPPPAVLAVQEGEYGHRFTGVHTPKPGAGTRSPGFAVTFAVPEYLEAALSEGLSLLVGGAEVSLPPAEFETRLPSAPDTAVAERRARRAEISERDLYRRAVKAEKELAHERVRARGLERRAAAAEEERDALETRLSSQLHHREVELRGARQRAESERRLRDEAAGEAAQHVERVAREAEVERLRARTLAAHAARLTQELESVRRSESEALQAASTADAARHHARRELAEALADLDSLEQRSAALERELGRLSERLSAATEARAAEPETPAAPVAPAEEEPAPAVHPPPPIWLGRALSALARSDPESSTRLALAMVPVQAALAPGDVDYDLLAAGAGWHRVARSNGRVEVSPLTGPRRRGESDFRVRASPRALTALLATGGRGDRGARPRVRGTLRRGRARRLLPAVPLRLDALAEGGAEVPAAIAFRALAQLIDPEWTRGASFCVAHEVRDGDGRVDACYVRVRDGREVIVAERPPETIDATVRSSRRAWTALITGLPPARDERPAIRGDAAAVARLHAWTRRAQGLEAP